MSVLIQERTHEILQYLTTTFPNIFPPMNQRRLSEDSGASTSVKSMITDLDTIGVAGKKIEDTMKLSHVMDLVKLFQVSLKIATTLNSIKVKQQLAGQRGDEN